MTNDLGGPGSFSRPLKLNTLLFDLAGNRNVVWIDGAFWPPVGAVVELEKPHGDAIVLGVRFQVLPPHGDHATILVDLQMPEEGREDFIARHPADQEFDAP